MSAARAMRARFVGADGSMGFRRGQTYDLQVTTTRSWLPPRTERPFIVAPVRCPYGSWDAFRRNWVPLGSERR